MRARDWILVTAVALLAFGLLFWAATRPVICAAAYACPAQGARLLPAVIGASGIAITLLVTCVLAVRSAAQVREGVNRSEGVIALGSMVVVLVGLASAVAALQVGGFALIIW